MADVTWRIHLCYHHAVMVLMSHVVVIFNHSNVKDFIYLEIQFIRWCHDGIWWCCIMTLYSTAASKRTITTYQPCLPNLCVQENESTSNDMRNLLLSFQNPSPSCEIFRCNIHLLLLHTIHLTLSKVPFLFLRSSKLVVSFGRLMPIEKKNVSCCLIKISLF